MFFDFGDEWSSDDDEAIYEYTDDDEEEEANDGAPPIPVVTTWRAVLCPLLPLMEALGPLLRKYGRRNSAVACAIQELGDVTGQLFDLLTEEDEQGVHRARPGSIPSGEVDGPIQLAVVAYQVAKKLDRRCPAGLPQIKALQNKAFAIVLELVYAGLPVQILPRDVRLRVEKTLAEQQQTDDDCPQSESNQPDAEPSTANQSTATKTNEHDTEPQAFFQSPRRRHSSSRPAHKRPRPKKKRR